MKIETYRKVTKKSRPEMAAELGVSLVTLWRYEHGQRRPSPEIMARIVRVTQGAVTPNDFFDMEAA